MEEINYAINKIKLGEDRVAYVPVLKDESLTIMQHFLSSEVRNFKTDILETIEMAKETSEKSEFAGNSCLPCIENGKVKIECALDEDEFSEPFEIQLDRFTQLVQSWINDTNI